MTSVFAIAISLAPACATDHVPPVLTTFVSGARLRAHVVDGGEGARVLVDWWDTELELNCEFAELEDGSIRCVPVLADSAASSPLPYSDERCTARALATSDAPAYVLEVLPACPGARARVRVYSPARRLGESLAYRLDEGVCVPAARVELTELVPADTSRFARATVTVDSHGELGIEVLVTDDRAKERRDLIDLDRGAPCSAKIADRDDTATFPRCLPETGSWTGAYFTSPDCTTGEGGAFFCAFATDGCAHPTLSVRVSGASHQLFELGAAVPSYTGGPAACREADFGICTFHPAGAEVSASLFPELADGTVGQGRLRALVRTALGDSTPLVARDLFRDTETGEVCAPKTFEGDVLRCLSVDAQTVNLGGITSYADPSCTIRVVYTLPGASAPPYAIELDQPEGVAMDAAPVRAIHRVGAAHSGDVFGRDGDSCVVFHASGLERWIVEDATIEPAAFAIVTDRIE